ncbi:MAG: glycosyltransferase family 39 protein, partial [Chloroflexota bacterium]|nr:glycosyltransferase family 39 protein [Chloroflexota bacterium]
MTEQRARRWLALIVAGYVVLATFYSFATPPFEASDELWHYPMVKYLADNGLQLPLQDPVVPTAWRQEGSQPPLYYMIAAVLTSWIDTSDLDYWRRINPHADIGVILPDGNVNMIVHRPNEGENRSTGALSALQISRTLSLVLGAGTVIVTWLLGRALFPQTPIIAVIASAFNAFLPMFLFISGSVNNDNLSNLLGNLLTLLVVRLLSQTSAPSLRQYVILGILMGAGLLAKLSLGFFIPIIALSLLIISLRRRDWRPLLIGGIISGALTIATAGWWYLRNWQLYGDPTGLNVFLDIVGRRAIPANAVQLWSERDSYLRAFWGFFGGVNVPMAENIYDIFNILGFFGMFSAMIFVVVYVLHRQQQKTPIWNTSIGLPHALSILWIVVTFVSYLRWTAETPASQGRLVFVALSSICVWLAVGWCWWLPRRAAGLAVLPVVWTGITALLAPFTIAPAYSTPHKSDVPLPTIEYYDFVAPEGGGIRIGASPITPSVQPDQYVRLNVYFETLAGFQRDWSLFVHLVTPDNVIVGQR